MDKDAVRLITFTIVCCVLIITAGTTLYGLRELELQQFKLEKNIVSETEREYFNNKIYELEEKIKSDEIAYFKSTQRLGEEFANTKAEIKNLSIRNEFLLEELKMCKSNKK